jgi:hypothetical protein
MNHSSQERLARVYGKPVPLGLVQLSFPQVKLVLPIRKLCDLRILTLDFKLEAPNLDM